MVLMVIINIVFVNTGIDIAQKVVERNLDDKSGYDPTEDFKNAKK